MGLFNKKKDNDSVEKTKVNKKEFLVTVYQDVGYSVKEVDTFPAERYVDDDKSEFLYNKERNFMELIPLDLHENTNITEQEVDKRLKELKDLLKNIQSMNLEDYTEDMPNTKDLEFDIMRYEAKKRSFKFSKSGSYISFNKHGQSCFKFIRRGTTMFPLKWDTDTNCIFTPSEPVKKTASMLIRNKQKKYNVKGIVDILTIVFLIVSGLSFIANIALGVWVWDKYDESNIAESTRKSLDVANSCGESIVNSANILNQVVKDNINKPPIIVGDTIPN